MLRTFLMGRKKAAGYLLLAGVDDETGYSTGLPGDRIQYFKFTASATGVANTIRVYASGAGNVKVAIYGGTDGFPSRLDIGSSTGAAVVAGWNDITITDFPVMQGRTYWIALLSDAEVCVSKDISGTNTRYWVAKEYDGYTWQVNWDGYSGTDGYSGAVNAGRNGALESKHYATWRLGDKDDSVVLTNGNLTAHNQNGSSLRSVRANICISSGKWYWEYVFTTKSFGGSTWSRLGIGKASAELHDKGPGDDANGWGYVAGDGQKLHAGSASAYGSAIETQGDVLGIALDMDAGKVWFAKNGTWLASGNPAAGTDEAFSGITGVIYPIICVYAGPDYEWWTANFGASAFAYTPPAGFNSGVYLK